MLQQPAQRVGCRAAHANKRSKHKNKQHMFHHSLIDAQTPPSLWATSAACAERTVKMYGTDANERSKCAIV